MKQGQFFSLTSALLIIILLSVYTARVSQVQDDEAFRVQRSQVGVLKHQAENFRSLDIPNALRTSSRFALSEYTEDSSSKLSYHNLTDIMVDGSLGNRDVMDGALSTSAQFDRVTTNFPALSADDVQVSYELLDASQDSPWTLQFTYNVSYMLRGDDVVTGDTVVYTVSISTETLTHPRYGSRITKGWVVNGTGCVVTDLFQEAIPCAGNNLSPP